MRNEKFTKGDLATLEVTKDLIKKGWVVLFPFGEQYSFDLVAMNKETKETCRIQVKSLSEKMSKRAMSDGKHYTKHGRSRGYGIDAFDFYACFIEHLDIIIYPPITLMNKRIRTNIDTAIGEFYWYKDFLVFNKIAPKKRTRLELTNEPRKYLNGESVKDDKIELRKTNRPPAEELQKLIWEKPTSQLAKDFGVSDVAISKWCKRYGIAKPPRGYWMKKLVVLPDTASGHVANLAN